MAAKKPPQIPGYSNYQRLPSMVLGFHGCDRSVGEAVLRGKVPHLEGSTNLYDWLGAGIYFWENDPRRAMEWAIEAKSRPSISKGQIRRPFVIGAVIELGHCLNLMSRHCIEELKVAHQLLENVSKAGGVPMPENKGGGFRRFLDRAVIETLHLSRGDADKEVPPYDTVRAAFREGDPAYAGAGFEEKNHIQIAVRDKARIKGYFRPFCD